MSARQTFIPRVPSRALPDSHPLTDVRESDADREMFVNRNRKPGSIAAFLCQKRSTGTDAASQGAGPTQGPSLGRTNTNTKRRSLESIRRPEMTPMSIIPYPATTEQLGVGAKQPGAVQTPRKTMVQEGFEFPRPMTPVSATRGFKKGFGIFAESRQDDALSNGNGNGNGVVFMGPGDDADARIGAGTVVGGYMRAFEEPGSEESAGEIQSSLGQDMAAPAPVYALGGLGLNPGDEGYEVDGVFARLSRTLDGMTETEVGVERSLGGTKRGLRREDMEGNGRYTDECHQTQGSAKRMKHVQRDPNEYFPISSPHIPPTPKLPTSSVDALDSTLLAGSLFENIEEFISLEEIEADWKRWRECTTEEWLKGADELAQEFADILNMVKDRLTEKVLAYASMVSSVEERRTEVNRNIEIIHGKGNVIKENISKLGTQK